MRIVAAEAPVWSAPQRERQREQRRARLECLGLTVTSVAIALGLWLAGSGQLAEHRGGGAAVILNGEPEIDVLATALPIFPTAPEREFAARAIARWIREHGPLTHVGALARVTVPSAEVRSDPRLPTLRARPAAPDTDVALFTPVEIAAIKPGLAVRSLDAWRERMLAAVIVFFLGFWVAHLVRRAGRIGDPVVVPAAQLLAGLGLVAMIALRDPLRDTDAATGFAWGVAFGCALLALLSFVDFENPRYRRATLLPLGGAVLLAAALVVFGSGPGDSGVKVNLLGVQPIEAIRLLAVLALASYFSRRWETLREHSEPAGPMPVRRYVRLPRARDVQPLVVIVGTLLVFFVLQRDLGPALVLGCLALAMYGVARARVALVCGGLLALVAGFAAGYQAGVPATLARRVAIWLDPWDNARAGGVQIAHALWALASGGPWGAGLGAGDGDLIPAGQTDLIVSVIGEELGLVGVAVICLSFALLIWRILRIAARAPGDYTAFLALGCGLALAVPAIIIAGGQFGLLPLSGVATPFLSFGKSSMVASFATIGIALAVATGTGPVRPTLRPQVRAVGWTLGICLALLAGRAAWIQVVHADALAVRAALTQQADGEVRYRYNPRLLQAARLLPRGPVVDRNGFALATGDPSQAEGLIERLRELRVALPGPCPPAPARCYPLGGLAFHAIGDWTRQLNWAARNASFVERDSNAVLQGFDDRPRTVDVQVGDGRRSAAIARDYRDLLPLLRHRHDLEHPDVQRLLERSREVRLTLDAPFQALVARALEARVRAAGAARGAVAVVDPATGALLALASYPWPDRDAAGRTPPDPASLLDRARYGLYPPGSTFKLITAAAALSRAPASALPVFVCERLPDGRVGARIRSISRPVRDDSLHRAPHGRVDLRKGLVHSCNAYFAQLALHLGPGAIADAAAPAGIQVSSTPATLNATLAHAGYGQGEVLASPLRMARVAAAIAGDGVIRQAPLVQPGEHPEFSETRWLPVDHAALLRGAMRDAVLSGSGRALAGHAVPIAGKTGTAEVSRQASHAWFVGFAPYGSPRIALAVIVENAGYGGRVAAPLAGDIVAAAAAAGLLK